jgi:hypothetical protein
VRPRTGFRPRNLMRSRESPPRLLGKGAIQAVQVKVVVHEAKEGRFWAEVQALPGRDS